MNNASELCGPQLRSKGQLWINGCLLRKRAGRSRLPPRSVMRARRFETTSGQSLTRTGLTQERLSGGHSTEADDERGAHTVVTRKAVPIARATFSATGLPECSVIILAASSLFAISAVTTRAFQSA